MFLLLIPGACIVLVAALIFGFRLSFVLQAKKAVGEIMAIRATRRSGKIDDSHSDAITILLIRYEDEDGETHEFETERRPFFKYKLREKVNIIYDPRNKEYGMVDGFLAKWQNILIATAIGGGLWLIGYLGLGP